jgi:hypothetical protein
MNNLRWAAIVAIAAALHLQAQTVTSAPSAARPTMEQTVAFIDETLNQHGNFSIAFPPTHKVITLATESQRLTQSDQCTLQFEVRALLSGKKPDGSPDTPFHYRETQEIKLASVDPRLISVDPDMGTTPPRWTIWMKVEDNRGYFLNGKPSSQSPRKMKLAVLLDKDLADRVAKAYIHAIVLCHKPEAPSPF